MKILETPRLILRTFEDSDLEALLAINQDPQVMRYFPSTVDRTGTQAMIERIQNNFNERGFCFYATELKSDGALIGFVGLNVPSFAIPHFQPKGQPVVEIGWRLSAVHWGKGYAPEASKEVLRHAFEDIGLEEVVSFTAKINQPSIRVMEKIGLQHNPEDDFIHPMLEASSPLSEHVLYRLAKRDY